MEQGKKLIQAWTRHARAGRGVSGEEE